MKLLIVVMLALTAFFLSESVCFAATEASVAVPQRVYTYGDGKVLVTGFHFPNSTCSNNGGFVIYGNHAHIAKILAVALTAKANGGRLRVVAKIDDCWYPLITEDSSTYVIFDSD